MKPENRWYFWNHTFGTHVTQETILSTGLNVGELASISIIEETHTLDRGYNFMRIYEPGDDY